MRNNKKHSRLKIETNITKKLICRDSRAKCEWGYFAHPPNIWQNHPSHPDPDTLSIRQHHAAIYMFLLHPSTHSSWVPPPLSILYCIHLLQFLYQPTPCYVPQCHNMCHMRRIIYICIIYDGKFSIKNIMIVIIINYGKLEIKFFFF